VKKDFCGFFLGFSDTVVNSGTTVMARRTGWRDRGVCGIPGVVADRGAGAARDGRCPGCGRCRRDSRHARRGKEGEDDRDFRKDEIAQRKGFANTCVLVSDLLGARNAGVTNLPHLK
jgi:hypothetical protein